MKSGGTAQEVQAGKHRSISVLLAFSTHLLPPQRGGSTAGAHRAQNKIGLAR